MRECVGTPRFHCFMAVLDYPERLIRRSGFLCSSREEIDWRLSRA
jgi:hypothetical protein